MNFFIKQSININMIRINAIANSSVFQIGSTGIIKAQSYLSNSGEFTAPAPEPKHPLFQTAQETSQVKIMD
ncbi:hypothetical protein AC622_15195 [Bacillus sp. FJAT-27916]|uniref:spore germination protein GerPB n=1 Tax=Bacillaceae TaxID=186817 RepID=UPI000670D424|nr:spore germination protein GerPB [Bacillus sp. FJAT-27916]KMY45403.1 hypothetical protein AC622_15195 [Bacillus sp. FJAT-27916]